MTFSELKYAVDWVGNAINFAEDEQKEEGKGTGKEKKSFKDRIEAVKNWAKGVDEKHNIRGRLKDRWADIKANPGKYAKRAALGVGALALAHHMGVRRGRRR